MTEEDKPYTLDDCLEEIMNHVMSAVEEDERSEAWVNEEVKPKIRVCLVKLWNAAIDRCNDAADEDIDDFYYIKEN